MKCSQQAADILAQSLKTQAEGKRLRKSTQAAGINFIKTELDLAVTFCDIAQSSDNPELRERNARRAKAALDSAQNFLAKNDVPETPRSEIARKIEDLRNLLDSDGNNKDQSSLAQSNQNPKSLARPTETPALILLL